MTEGRPEDARGIPGVAMPTAPVGEPADAVTRSAAEPHDGAGAGQAPGDPAALVGAAVEGPADGPADTLPPPTGAPVIDMPPTADETPTAVISAVPADVPLGGSIPPDGPQGVAAPSDVPPGGPDDAPTQLIPVQAAPPVAAALEPAAPQPMAQTAAPSPQGPGSPAGWVWPTTPIDEAPEAAQQAAFASPPPNPFTPSVQPPALTQQLPVALQTAAAPPPPTQYEPTPAPRPSGMGFPAPPSYAVAPGPVHPDADHPVVPPRRRRTALISTLAAVAVVGVATAVITLNGGSSPQHSSTLADTTGQSAPVGPSGNAAAGAAGLTGTFTATSSAASSSASSSASSAAAKSSRSGDAIATATGSSAPAVPNLDASLALHWRFADGGGSTAADSGPRGIAGHAAGPVKFGPTHGGSAVFTPASGQIKGGQITANGVLDTTKSFTVSEWVYQTTPTTPTKYVSAFSQDGPNFSAFFFTYSTAQQTWFFGRSLSATTNNGTDESWGSPSPLNTWILLTGVYDATAGTVTLYANGVPQTAVHTRTAPYAANGPFVVGRSWYQTYPSNPFAGSVADVRVYNRVLTPAEVHSLLSAG